ncbi:MAG: branched-chain amino acid ABC transporter permease [Chloroflexi bacterium]|nr:branched-chain amino acid ABC transporter permease [Chloroflexota bacterium]MBI5053372.1 branched-chain amino acid ABC transporter permease [Chloroflexota bacterium]MBI5348504.1 branched-chain amino acid ABC transporter permease [Chloroflexota bacterium]
MNIEALIASTFDGLMLGFVFGLMAMGLTLIFGVMKVINLGHGPLIAIGMFAVLVMSQSLGINPYLTLPVIIVIGLLTGIVMYFVALHRVINSPELTTLLATFSVNMMITGLMTVIFSTSPRGLDVTLGSLQFGRVTILGTRVAAVVIAVVVTVALYFFLYRTRQGKSIRAVANNRGAAELMGINSSWVLGLSFGIGAMLAMISGMLLATMFSFTVLTGNALETKSFVIVVLGGLGNPTGALFGGIIIGLLESITTIFIPVSWVPVLEFVVFIMILLVRPNGIFGARSS